MVDLNPNTISNPINFEGLMTKAPGWAPDWVKNHWMPIHYDTLYPGEADKVEKIIIDCNPNDGIMFVNGPMMNQVLHMPNPTEHYVAAVPEEPIAVVGSWQGHPTYSTKKVVYSLKVDTFKIGHVIYKGKFYWCDIPWKASSHEPSYVGKSWDSQWANQVYQDAMQIDPWEPEDKIVTRTKPVTMSLDVDYTSFDHEALNKIFGNYGKIKKGDPEEPALWEQI